MCDIKIGNFFAVKLLANLYGAILFAQSQKIYINKYINIYVYIQYMSIE